MDTEALSVSKQLRSRELDTGNLETRDELHVWGALEAWLATEGLQPWDPEVVSYHDNGSAVFGFGSGFWVANTTPSINFPELVKFSLSLDLVAIPKTQVPNVLEMMNSFWNPHFGLKMSEVDQDFVVSAYTVIAGEPKNYQLAIGVAINDILSIKDSLVQEFAAVPGCESLLNY